MTRVACPTGLTAWLVSRYADVREILGGAERFSSRPGQVVHLMAHADPERPIGKGEFTRMDGPDYQRFRRHMGPEVSSPRRLAKLRPLVRAAVDERIGALADAGPPADLYQDFAIPVTTASFGGLVGVPYADRDLFHRAASGVFSDVTDQVQLAAAVRPLQGYLFELVRRRRIEPEDDALSRMVARAPSAEPPFSDVELVAMSAVMLVAGFDSTATALAHGVLALLTDPDQWARLRDDPSLVPGTVEEMVRLFGGGAGIVREATTDTGIGGHPVAEGDYIILAIQSANHDPEAFDDPGRLDVARDAEGHLGFGHGTHQCFGQQTARLELTVALEALARRVPSPRLAAPLADVPFKTGTSVVGPERVPVAKAGCPARRRGTPLGALTRGPARHERPGEPP
ncbi:cytochrome P450 [Streptomyces sp. PT12]|nr:cytochrome P450 [Streptomyces sp. PT12]